MIRNIIIAILIIMAILLLAYYYKASSLNLDTKGVTLKVKEKTVFFETTRVKTLPIVFSNLNIMQSRLSNGTYYEVATCESSYIFNQNMKDIVKILFKARKIDELFSIGGLSALRITLENFQVINMFIDDNDEKELKFIYGIPYELFSPAVKKIMGMSFKDFPLGGLFELPAPMSKWNLLDNNIDGIITSIDD